MYEASGGGTTDSWIDIQTDALGNYDASGLPTGNYRVRFDDNDWGLYRGEFYNDATTFASSNDVAVVAGATTPNINASLAYLANGTLTGTVKEGASGLAASRLGAGQRLDDHGRQRHLHPGRHHAGHLHRDLLQGRLRHPDTERDDHCGRH